jgi:CDP-diacylglycerol--serine O-phosphatidyltransferase
MRPKHLIPNAVTLANIALGFLCMVAAARGHFETAVIYAFWAAICDLLDGRLARALDASTTFGMELDSLSDMVSFGMAPALLVYLSVLHKLPLGWPGAVIAIAFPLCGAIRLARYNSDKSAIGKVTFLGCPIPIAASYLWSMVLVRDALSMWAIAAGTLILAGTMVSTLKVPKFRKGEGLPAWMMFLGLGFFIVFLFRRDGLTWHIWNGWNIVLIICNYILLARKGHLHRREHLKAA